jgi:DinB superfamily
VGRSCGEDLRDIVARTAPTLRAMPVESTGLHGTPGKWSAREIIGHLIDSASNNHQRFVRAALGTHLRFEGYEQDAWVRMQNYADAPWPDLVALWESLNLHIARVMDAIPQAVAVMQRTDHNLDAIAWETVPAQEPVTLEYFMRDYASHLQHHLRQIDAGLAQAPVRQRGTGAIRAR